MSGWTIAPALLVAVLGVILIGNTLGRYTGATVSRSDPAALLRRLAPHYAITRPVGGGPFPTALLLSGCDGPRDNLVRLAGVLKARGWASIVVDSRCEVEDRAHGAEDTSYAAPSQPFLDKRISEAVRVSSGVGCQVLVAAGIDDIPTASLCRTTKGDGSILAFQADVDRNSFAQRHRGICGIVPGNRLGSS